MGDALFPDNAKVEIIKKDGIAYNITVDIDSFEESGFERETETRPFFGGASVTIKSTQAEGEIKMNAKLTRALWDQMFWGGSGSQFTSGGTQDAYRITFLVTNQSTPAVTTATQALGAGEDHYRKVYAECYMTAFNPKLEVEGMLEGEATFKVAPKDPDANANILMQISDAATGSGFPAIAAYTTSTKW